MSPLARGATAVSVGGHGAEILLFAGGGAIPSGSEEPVVQLRGAARDSLSPFVKAARSTSRKSAEQPKTNGDKDAAAVRGWAAGRRIDVSHRGRIPRSVREQYENR
ncbi:Lsr2 family DNA-binding protein [Micromonospora sp. DT81.3]|uniref:Lsr2 family DNA-binding protein n=1 Tax=Micromonospora sp. DT81.3 TaxID=3416523 RepID=UPI003CEA8BAB